MRTFLLRTSIVLAFGGGIGTGLACSDRDHGDACYARDTGLDWEGRVELRPVCEWGPASEPYPDPPDGYANTWQVLVTFEPTDEMPCDPCDVERFDALLEAQVEEQCDQQYVLVQGCYIPAEEFNGRCQVIGLYHTNCDAPTKE